MTAVISRALEERARSRQGLLLSNTSVSPLQKWAQALHAFLLEVLLMSSSWLLSHHPSPLHL